MTLPNIDEDKPFVVESHTSEVAISATLNQDGRPVAFISRKFELHELHELHYLSVEKEATAIIESVRKWEHLLRHKHFMLITDQRSVTLLMNNPKRTKIKNNKILNWSLELASLSYTIQYCPGPENVAASYLVRPVLHYPTSIVRKRSMQELQGFYSMYVPKTYLSVLMRWENFVKHVKCVLK